MVQFNSINPLKAALLHPDTSPVVIAGPLVRSNCGSSASANPYAAENTHHLSGTGSGLGEEPSLISDLISELRSAWGTSTSWFCLFDLNLPVFVSKLLLEFKCMESVFGQTDGPCTGS